MHEDPMVDQDHLMATLPQPLVAWRQARPRDVLDIAQRHEFLIDPVDHLRATITPNDVGNLARPQHARSERSRKEARLKALENFEERNLKLRTVIA